MVCYNTESCPLNKINIKIDRRTHKHLHRVQADMELQAPEESRVTFSETLDRLIVLYDQQKQVTPISGRQVTRPRRVA